MKKKFLREFLSRNDPYHNAPKWVKQVRAHGINVDLGAWLPKEYSNGQG